MNIRSRQASFTSLLVAASDGHLATIESASDDELRAAVCLSGCTVLHYAAGSNQIDVIDYLLSERHWSVDMPVAPGSKAHGRTPLHYACRNGCLDTVRHLTCHHRANPDTRAKQGVTPLQLAVWRLNLYVARYLVDVCNVDPLQTNDFECGLVHWLGIAPVERAGKDGERLIEMARWLQQLPGMDFHARQRQGHSILHKAAWQGHEEFVKYLHEQHNVWDDQPDSAGNYAADLADMANSSKHARIALYLREYCSKQRAESCRVLNLTLEEATDPLLIKKAYRLAVRKCHPDKMESESSEEFHRLTRAYTHLTEERGMGKQCNPTHSLKLMLQLNNVDSNEPKDDNDFFKARLAAVILEYGDEGVDLSNVKKKWKQVWPSVPFPSNPTDRKSLSLSKFLQEYAGDVIAIKPDDKGCLRVFAKTISRAQVITADADFKISAL